MFKSLNFAARAFPLGLFALVVGAGLYFDHSASFAVEREQPAVQDARGPGCSAPLPEAETTAMGEP